MSALRFSLPLTILLASLVIPALLHAADVAGPVWGIWSLADSPYNVLGEIFILENQTLTIEPGVQVIFQGWYKFVIRGSLQAVGTALDSITFTAANWTVGWHGLRFYDIGTQADSSRLVYCKISYGKSSAVNSAGDDKNGGAIFCTNSSKLRIEHCSIRENRTSNIFGFAGSPGTGPNIPGGQGESAVSGSGGALYLFNSNPKIIYNTMFNNSTGNATGGSGGAGYNDDHTNQPAYGSNGGSGGSGVSGDGGAICCINSAPLLLGNTFFLNLSGTALGGSGGLGGSAFGSGLAIAGNGGGGGSSISGSGAGIFTNVGISVVNNLFVDNMTGTSVGGAGGDGGWAGLMFGGHDFGGDGGNGGNANSGSGSAIIISDSDDSPFIDQLTLNINACGTSQPGAGGAGGDGNYQPGMPGNPGIGTNGSGAIRNNSTYSQIIQNSIFWMNTSSLVDVVGVTTLTYCDIDHWIGIGNFFSDPLFVGNPPLNNYYLSQISAGQPIQSACVDAANPNSPLFLGTTRTDGVQDSGIVDMGFHYSSVIDQPFLWVIPQELTFGASIGYPNPDSQSFVITNLGIGSFVWDITSPPSWLSLSSLSGGPIYSTSADTVFASVDITGLPVGEYTGLIIISAPGALNSPDTVLVQLVIGQSELSLMPDTLRFFAHQNSLDTLIQYFRIDNIGTGWFDYSIAESIPWLIVFPDSGGPVPPDQQITALAFPNGMEPGFYQGDIQVTAFNAIGSPGIAHVELNVSSSLGGALNGIIEPGIYEVEGNISVPFGEHLIISPGVTLNFWNSTTFTINGSLWAVGNENDSIIFQSSDSTLNWGGLRFNEVEGDSNQVQYARISGSNASAVQITDSRVVMANCTITNNTSSTKGGGLRIDGSSSLIEHCVISHNTVTGAPFDGGGVYVWGERPVITNCCINYNTGANTGGGISLNYTDALIAQCTISNNAISGIQPLGAGIYISQQASLIISNCTIASNFANGSGLNWGGAGIYSTFSTASIEGCLITDNTFIGGGGCGAGIFFDHGQANITNCTLSRNNLQGLYSCNGGGMYLSYPICTILNCIINNNRDNGIYITSGSSAMSISYNNVSAHANGNFFGYLPLGLGILTQINLNGDSCDVYHNILLDPLLVNPDSGDYHLTANSPCIDAGDPTSPLDPDSTITDMGAFYFDHIVGVQEEQPAEIPTIFSLQPPSPNPFNPTTTIHFGLPVASRVTLEVFDIAGRNVGAQHAAPLHEAWFPAGYHEITFDGSNLSSGIYICRIQAGEFTACQKLVLLK